MQVTRDGRPAKGAAVSIEMLRHAFPFGSAVTARRLVSDETPDGLRYREAVTSLFNRVVFENDMKWPAWEGAWGEPFARTQTLAAVQWLKDRNLDIRGHCLVWPGWKNLPERLREFEYSPSDLVRESLTHIHSQATALRGNIAEYDVVNETFWNHDIQDLAGRDVMLDWFAEARNADPDALLFINDARIVSFYGLEAEHKDHYFNEVEWLVDRGAELDGIGFQCHFRDASLTPPEEALAMLDRFAVFALALGITEFDIQTEDEQRQARYTHDFMHVMFSHPLVNSFVMWGFWEGQIYKEPRAMIRRDWSLKPNGEVYRDLVFRKWWTREQASAAADGLAEFRGFLGTYLVRAEQDGMTAEATIQLSRAGTLCELEMRTAP